MSIDFSNRSQILDAMSQVLREHSTATVLFHTVFAECLGLNPTDHKSLDIIARHGSLTAGELSEITGLTTGAITGVIDRLEKAGFVQREKDPNDRRRVIIRPYLDTSEQRVRPLLEALRAPMVELYAHYTNEELVVIMDFMKRSIKALQEATHNLKDIKSSSKDNDF